MFKLNDEHVTSNICQSIKQPKDMYALSVIDTVEKDALVAPIEERLRFEVLTIVIMNFKGDDINGYEEMVSMLDGRGSHNFAAKKLDLNLKSRVTSQGKHSFIKKPPVLEIKALPLHLSYVFLGANNTL